jgi:hypothetical protein
MSLYEKYDESLWSDDSDKRHAYDAIVSALPLNMGARYYLNEALKTCDAGDAGALQTLIGELDDE